ncbi:MAG: hypothetical protein ACON5J_17770 [Rubripirellula sp.]
MTGRIYLLNEQSQLMPMDHAAYDSELLLQDLLANHPDLMAGEQINSDDPRRWLLVAREMSVPDEEAGSRRWSLDHLFIDQEGIPTLVEVKRSSDTRIRREVVGQMLDYAANAVVHWPVEDLRARFESRCDNADERPDEVLGEFLNQTLEIDEFWLQVKTNLQAGRIRMIFLADDIPSELRRVVEFLNEQMDPAEVLAIEIRQFIGQGVKTLVPQVLGQTETTRQRKRAQTGRQESASREEITEANFMSIVRSKRTSEEAEIIEQLIQWARSQGLEDDFRQGQLGAVFYPQFIQGDVDYSPIVVHQDGHVRIQMRRLKNRPPFDSVSKRSELHQRIKDIPGLALTDAGMEGLPLIPIESLTEESQRTAFLNALDFILTEVRELEG